MNARELVSAALRGEPTPRCPCGPLAVHFTAADAGVSLRDYTLSARLLAECVIRYYERYRPDAVWVSADTWVTAEAMGATVRFPDENQPAGGIGGAIERRTDVAAIPPPDVASQGRWPLMLEATARIRRALGDEVFIVGCLDQSPFSLACALLEISQAMISVIEDPELLSALLERCIEYSTAYGQGLAEAGADMLSTGDSPAGLLSPEQYRQFALPAERRLFAALRETGTFTSLHICGDATHILPDMCTAGSHVLELDSALDLDFICRTVPEEIAAWGNLDCVSVLARGTPESVQCEALRALETVKRHGRRRFVLSSGCTLTTNTPEANLRALLAAPMAS